MVDLVQNDDGSASFEHNSVEVFEMGRYPQYATNVLRVAADVADAETVTIGGTVFEFDRAANGVTAGRVAVTGHADDTPAAATDALITAINATTSCPMTAVDISANEVLLVSKKYGAHAHACTETLAGSNNAFASATAYGGRAPGNQRLAVAARVPNATEVAVGNLHFPVSFTPASVNVEVRVTSTGVVKAWDGAVAISAGRVTINNAGSTDWAATDTVYIQMFE
jgi:hypothetical protein